MSVHHGHCACGAVTLRAEVASPELWACWCAPCRRWQGLVGIGIEVPETGFSAEGPVRVWESSAIGRRAFCGECGSALGFWPIGGRAVVEPCAGLFANAAGAVLDHENFVERRPPAIGFVPQPRQLTAQDYAAQEDGAVVDMPQPRPDTMAGGCACGAVRFRLSDAGDNCAICHCDTCRRWTGGIYCVVTTTAAHLHVEGQPALIRWASSPGVERVSCAACGGKLWYAVLTHDASGGVAGEVEVCLGAIDDMGGRALSGESFIDDKPAAYAIAGDHPRRTRAEAMCE